MEPGVLVRESRRIIPSHGGVPYFALDEGHATEDAGSVWFGTLKWSGNWKLLAEKAMDGRHIIHLGLNDHDFGWDLDPGEEFATPALVFGFTAGGHGAASRHFHDYVRAIAPRPGYVPPVVYNSWYATLFDVDEVGQTALADIAAKMGVELFVMDDGWFSGRVKDNAGLGDWWPDAKKFPNGLKPLLTPSTIAACSSGCGSSPRWSIRIQTSIEATPIGSCIIPGGSARCCATSRSSIWRASTCRTI